MCQKYPEKREKKRKAFNTQSIIYLLDNYCIRKLEKCGKGGLQSSDDFGDNIINGTAEGERYAAGG